MRDATDSAGPGAVNSKQSSMRRSRLHGDVAIIGMACLFPGAPNLDAFWQNIVNKVDATTDAPLEAWDPAIFYDPESTSPDRVYCKRGGFLGPIAQFNPLVHGIVPRAVEGGEPDQWLALQLAYDALADAGYANRLTEREDTPVILGRGTYINRGNLSLVQHGLMVEQVIQVLRRLQPQYDEGDFEAIRQELKKSLPPLDTDTASALIPNVIAGRVANRLDLMGPSYTVDAACASALVAIEIAMRDLLTGHCNLALVGGAQITTSVPTLSLFCQLNALSHRQQLRAFDADADGTILGEGIGMVVLKRREDAERDGDRIYAVIKGVGTASDGRAVSVMAPRVEGEVLALRRAYEMAGISPRTVALIEAHGTGTPVGDVVEVQALAEVFGPRDGRYPWCGIGSVKTMIGHTMPAAGIAGVIKAALALYHKALPPTLHCDTPNPKLGLDQTPFYISTETRPWIHGAQETPRRAGVNAFGFGGINAHAILEEHGSTTVDVAKPDNDADLARSHHLHWDSEVCILRADSREALLDRIEHMQVVLAMNDSFQLKDVAYTWNVTMPDGTWRLAVVATSIADLRQKLARASERLADHECDVIRDVRGIYFTAQPLAPHGKVAFLFPGEGSQYVNMLADLCLHFPEVRVCFDRMDRVYLGHPRNYLLSDVVFPRPSFSKDERAAAAQQLWQIDSAIEAVYTANVALATLLGCLSIQPDAILGHSTGEYSALHVAGIIDLSDDDVYVRFSQSLHHAYENAEDGVPRATLLAIGANREQVAAIAAEVDGLLYVAMDNCPHQTVLAGEEETIQRAAALAREKGFIHEILPFDRAYHTPLFAAYAEALRQIYDDLPVAAPTIETYSCTSMGPYPSDPAAIRALALDHWIKPVEFTKAIEALYESGVRIFVESGPKGNLTSFVNDILGDRPYLAVPANVSRRSGITGLNHMVAMLATHGVTMTLDYLYRRRAPQRLSMELGSKAAEQPRHAGGLRKLATGWPPMDLSPTLAEHLRAKSVERGASILQDQPAAEPVVEDGGHTPSPHPERPPVAALTAADGMPSADAGSTLPATPAAPDNHAGSAIAQHAGATAGSPTAVQAMHAYLHTMDQFMAMQEQLMQNYIRMAHERRAARRAVYGANGLGDNSGAAVNERTLE